MAGGIASWSEGIVAFIGGGLAGNLLKGPSCPSCPPCPSLSCENTTLIWTPALALGLVCIVAGIVIGRLSHAEPVAASLPVAEPVEVLAQRQLEDIRQRRLR